MEKRPQSHESSSANRLNLLTDSKLVSRTTLVFLATDLRLRVFLTVLLVDSPGMMAIFSSKVEEELARVGGGMHSGMPQLIKLGDLL